MKTKEKLMAILEGIVGNLRGTLSKLSTSFTRRFTNERDGNEELTKLLVDLNRWLTTVNYSVHLTHSRDCVEVFYLREGIIYYGCYPIVILASCYGDIVLIREKIFKVMVQENIADIRTAHDVLHPIDFAHSVSGLLGILKLSVIDTYTPNKT